MPMLSRNLEKTLRRSLALANARQHEYATLEHLLMALTEDEDAAAVLEACAVDLDRLRAGLDAFLDHELTGLAAEGVVDAKPTAGVQRAMQRAAMHVQSAGRSEVTGANVLVALFSERESHAVYFLQEQDMSRLDAVNFLSHGIAKRPGVSEPRPRRRDLEWDVLRIVRSSEAVESAGANLDNILRRTVALASVRQRPYATLDHLLMALTDDEDAVAVLKACGVEVDRLRAKLDDMPDDQLAGAAVDGAVDARPTAGVRRVILRAAIDAQRFGTEATGANLLTALFAERETQARQGRLDARYKVVLLNDDDTPMEFVAEVLERFFDKSREDAARLMLQVHTDGVGICGVYSYEIAETKVSEVVDHARRHHHPLRCTMEED